MRRTLSVLTLLAAFVLLSACGGGSGGGSSTGTATVHHVTVTIHGKNVQPQQKQLTIGVGDAIAVELTSDRAGVLHVHSSPEHEYDFKPGTHTYRFTLDKPGQVDIEEHVSDTLLFRVTVQ